MRVHLIALAICGVILAAAVPARAERVALIRPDAADAVLMDAFNRLRAELEIHHFEAEIVDANLATISPDALEQIAQENGALASIALMHHGTGTSVDVWLVDRVSGKTTMRRLDVGKSRDAASVLAIRAVDLLRASLEEYEPDERPPPEVVGVDPRPVPPAVRTLTAPPTPTTSLQVEGLALYNGPDLGFCYGPSLALHQIWDSFELGLVIAGPLLGASFHGDNGSASSRQEIAWIQGRYMFLHAEPFELGAELGLGMHFLQAEGQPEPPLVPRSDSVYGFLGTLGAHARFALGSSAAIGLSLRGIGLFPRQGVAVLDEAALLGQPLFSASLGAIVGL